MAVLHRGGALDDPFANEPIPTGRTAAKSIGPFAAGEATSKCRYDRLARGDGLVRRSKQWGDPHVFRNGVRIDQASIAGSDGVGVRRFLTLDDLRPGDLIDFALDPRGPNGQSIDQADGATFTSAIWQGESALTTLVPPGPRGVISTMDRTREWLGATPHSIIHPGGRDVRSSDTATGTRRRSSIAGLNPA